MLRSIPQPELAELIHEYLLRAPAECWLMGEAWDRAVAQKRQRLDDKPDPKRRLAEFIASEIVAHGFRVDHDEPKHPGSPPPWRGDR